MRAKQVEQILSGEEPRDPTSAFLASLVQDLRDVSRAEVPSNVAARHLQRMRLATETGVEGGPDPLLEAEEGEFQPAPAADRRKPLVAAVGLAAAMVMLLGASAAITNPPEDSGTRARGVVGSAVPVPPRPWQGVPGRSAPSTNDIQTAATSSNAEVQPPPGGNTGTVGGGAAFAGTMDGGGSSKSARGPTTDGSGGGAGKAGSGTDSVPTDNPTDGGTDGSTEPGKRETKAQGNRGGNSDAGGGGGNGRGGDGGHDRGGKSGGDGPKASGDKGKGSGKKADR